MQNDFKYTVCEISLKLTLARTPNTLHPEPYTLHPTSYTLHPTPDTRHPTPYSRFIKRGCKGKVSAAAGGGGEQRFDFILLMGEVVKHERLPLD